MNTASQESAKFGKDAGLLHQVAISLRAVCNNDEEAREVVSKLAHNRDLLLGVRNVVVGRSEICPIKLKVSTTRRIWILKGLKIASCWDKEISEIDPSKILLVQSPKQKRGNSITGKDLRDMFPESLDVRVMEALYRNPVLIPDTFKGKFVSFLGATLHGAHGNKCFPHLCFVDDKLLADYRHVEHLWWKNDYVAVLAE